jgi:hypothetical protein
VLRLLNLDHLGTHVAKQHGAEGTCEHARQIDNPDALQWWNGVQSTLAMILFILVSVAVRFTIRRVRCMAGRRPGSVERTRHGDT